MSIRPVVNADTLRWARTTAGWTEDELAKRLNVKPAQVAAWEAGDAAPTLRQLQMAARTLGRTAASFLIAPPATSGVPETVDFRGGSQGGLSHAAVRELRRLETYRDYFLDLPRYDDLAFTLRAFSWETVGERASDLRTLLGIASDVPSARTLAEWIRAVESLGILVFQATGIEIQEFRGVSVFHEPFPIILLNGADSDNGRIFSLFHEVAHLANRSSGLCDNTESASQEVLANRFSAEFLMPARAIGPIIEARPRDGWVHAVSKRFGASTLAAGIRLHNLGLIEDDELEAVREDSLEAWRKHRRELKDKPGFVPHWRLRQRDLSTTYLEAVFDALDEARIDYVDATYMLNAKLPTIDRLRDESRTAGGHK